MIKPTQDYVLLELVIPNAKNVTASGILLPETAKKDQPQVGYVKAVGPGVASTDGELIPMSVKPGDKVMFAMFAGHQVSIDGKTFLMVREREIYGVIKDD